MEGESARQVEAAGDLNVLPDYDPEWLRIVEDVVFVIGKAQDCDIPTRGTPTPGRTVKRHHETEPNTPRKRLAVNATPLKKTRSRV